MLNTFAAHQLLDLGAVQGLQHPLKMALFDAHFTQGRDVNDSDVLADVAASVGLDRSRRWRCWTAAAWPTNPRSAAILDVARDFRRAVDGF